MTIKNGLTVVDNKEQNNNLYIIQNPWWENCKIYNDNGLLAVFKNNSHWNPNKLHRKNGPAIIFENGTKKWYLNGRQHREDGPAIEWEDGGSSWYINGQVHREDGPALEFANGSKCWYINGMRHREDGPAIVYKGEDEYRPREWYLHDIQLDTKKVENFLTENNVDLSTNIGKMAFKLRFV